MKTKIKAKLKVIDREKYGAVEVEIGIEQFYLVVVLSPYRPPTIGQATSRVINLATPSRGIWKFSSVRHNSVL